MEGLQPGETTLIPAYAKRGSALIPAGGKQGAQVTGQKTSKTSCAQRHENKTWKDSPIFRAREADVEYNTGDSTDERAENTERVFEVVVDNFLSGLVLDPCNGGGNPVLVATQEIFQPVDHCYL